ncbi:MAG: hypothetical protein KBC12_00340 [Candidatus Pacebacteria bacterium]|nr:hypothetical protein [Candidatus Paceibacterota bacterium]MBP9851101.1 hypothetical protein [Candidatus Paceibacterota bacterium]
MQSHIFKNTVTAFLVMLFVFSPVLEVKKAAAQTGGGYPTTGSYSYGSGGTSGGLSGYIKGLGPAITQLPKCKKKIKGAIKSLFGKSKGILAKEASGTLGTSLGGTISQSAAQQNTIQNYDKEANDKLKKQDTKLSRIDEATGSLDENSSCLDSIGKLIIDRMIQRITLATVEWIKTGNSGGPAFVQDPGRFLRDIAKEEILTFGLELNLGADCQAVFSGNVLGTTGSTNIDSTDDCLNPYGKSWFKYQAEAFNKKFNDNARYSLNELIAETTPQYTGASFHANFSSGGWNAWTALTSVPANNPVGFGLLAETELSKRLAGVQKSTAEQVQDALKESNGFLGDYRCADPEGTTKDQHKAALESGDTDLACKRWEYVTPGRAVAEEALKISHFQENKLIRADTLNDAMAAIVDALIQRFSNELYEKGLAGFSDEGSDGGLILNAYAIDGSYGINQVEQDFPEYLQGSEWFNAHSGFNIRTDLTQAIIDEQRVFAEKLQTQNEVLERVIQWTQVLDYCIPGPSPKKYRELNEIDLFSDTEEVTLKFDLAELVLSFDPTGIFSGIGQAIFEKQHEKEVKKIIATRLGLMFDIHIYGAFGYTEHEDQLNIQQDQILNKDDMEGLGKNIIASYKEVIHNTYFNGSKSAAPMPIVTNEARNEFERIDAYKGIIEENDDRVGLMNAVVQRLGRIKETIEDLGPQPDPTDPAFEDYENSLKPFIAEFGRLTGEMVTGDDIAKAHKLLQEMEDKEVYIHDDLLTGPGGCEEEMIKLYDDVPDGRALYSKFYRRQPYGEPIPYLYGSGVTGSNISPYDPGPKVVLNPHDRTAWSELSVKNWNPNDGFLFGSVYWNFWARPYDGGNAYQGDNKTHNPPNLGKIRNNSCPEFIDVVYFSFPNRADLGGLEPQGALGYSIPYGPNNCGVITRRLEEMLGMW